MAIAIQPYAQSHIPAVKAFNQRLAQGGVGAEFRFPESEVPEWLPPGAGRSIFQRFFLALEDDAVRGGFILKQQDFSVRGELRSLTFYHLPLSEGIIAKKYAGIGVHMLRSAQQLAPALFCLGMGGFDRPLPQMLRAMGWSLDAVPFHFRVEHPARFLREIGPLREPAGRRWAARLAAASGLGWLGVTAAQHLRRRAGSRGAAAEPIGRFGPWADELWERARGAYPLIASRDADTLNLLYPSGGRFLALRIHQGDETLGWAVVLDTRMSQHKYFGNLRVGTIADALADVAQAPEVVAAATRFLQERGVDLVISNQSHRVWRAALQAAGFLPGPTNFLFAGSKPFMAVLGTPPLTLAEMFWNRGDGDGPVNL